MASFKTDQAPAAMGQAFVMGHQHQGGAVLLVQFKEQVGDALAGVAVQVAGGFIGKQHVGVGGERPGDGNPLLLATRKLAWRVAQALAQTDALEQMASMFWAKYTQP